MRLIGDALLDLRAHRVRSALAALGLFLAILSVVAVTTIGTVVRDVFVARDEQLNGRLWTMVATMDYGLLTSSRLADVIQVLDRQVTNSGGDYALRVEQPGEAAPLIGEGAGPSESVRIVLVAGDLTRVRRLPLLGGRWISTTAIFPDGVVLNENASARYGGVGTWLHLRLSDHLLPYDRPVVGVVADGRDEPRVYESLRSTVYLFPSIASGANFAPELLVHFSGASQATERLKVHEVAELLGVPAESVEVHVSNGIADFLSSLEQQQRSFAAVSAMTLLVAVVGLLNIGLATLRERTRELSLRRALGATRGRLFALVLTTTLALSGLVAAVAIALAYVGVVWWLPHFLNPASAIEAPGFPWQAAVYGGLAALAAGLAGGLVPALAAARVDMVQVLRE
jgi:ABC-type antimicrobial peptide transport system permease subunit